jgi:hypothetical protein
MQVYKDEMYMCVKIQYEINTLNATCTKIMDIEDE